MQNHLKRLLALGLAFSMPLSCALFTGCGKEENKNEKLEQTETENDTIFSVLIRDKQTGAHYTLAVGRDEFSASQAAVLARLQDSGVRVTVSLVDRLDQLSNEQKKTLIADVVAAYEQLEQGGDVTPEPPDKTPTEPSVTPTIPDDTPDYQLPVTLQLKDQNNGKIYDVTFEGKDLDDADKAMIEWQKEKGAVTVYIQKDPADMTELEKSELLQLALIEMHFGGKDDPVKSKGVVYVDAGHGFTNSHGVPDKGTGEGSPYHKLTGKYESDLNIAIALRLRDLLVAEGYEVIMSREGEVDQHLTINDRVRMINAVDADIFISVHGNAASAKASGARVYWNQGNSSASISEKYAEKVAEAINQTEGTTLVEAKVYEGDYAVVRDTHIPAVLVETCFLTNEADAELASTPAWTENMAKALCMGIVNQLTSY